MDICTVEHRAFDGSKYMVVLRDKMSLAFEVVYLHLRSDAIAEIARWISRMRSDPAFQSMDYQVVSHIETDDAGDRANGDGRTQNGRYLRTNSNSEQHGNVQTERKQWHHRQNAQLASSKSQ